MLISESFAPRSSLSVSAVSSRRWDAREAVDTVASHCREGFRPHSASSVGWCFHWRDSEASSAPVRVFCFYDCGDQSIRRCVRARRARRSSRICNHGRLLALPREATLAPSSQGVGACGPRHHSESTHYTYSARRDTSRRDTPHGMGFDAP